MATTSVSLSNLPEPDLVAPLDYETILADMKAAVVAALPAMEPVLELESEPATAVLQVCAYYALLNRAAINDSARAVMLPYATGADLDNLAAVFGVTRKTIVAADPDAFPPVAAVMESDEDMRLRVALAPELLTIAGPRMAYRAQAISADDDVRDAYVDSPEPGIVRVTLVSYSNDGVAPAGVISSVQAALSADDVRPLCDTVVVEAASLSNYSVTAALTLTDVAQSVTVLAEAEASLSAYVEQRRALNTSVPVTGIIAALHVAGVESVSVTAPASSLAADPQTLHTCTAINISEA